MNNIYINNHGRIGNLILCYYFGFLFLSKMDNYQDFLKNVKIQISHYFRENDGRKITYHNYLQHNILYFKNLKNFFVSKEQYYLDCKKIIKPVKIIIYTRHMIDVLNNIDYYKNLILNYSNCNIHTLEIDGFPFEKEIYSNFDTYYDSELITKLFYNEEVFKEILSSNDFFKKNHNEKILGISLRYGDRNDNYKNNIEINQKIDEYKDYKKICFSDEIEKAKIFLNRDDIFYYTKSDTEPDYISHALLTSCDKIIGKLDNSSFILTAYMFNKAFIDKIKAIKI